MTYVLIVVAWFTGMSGNGVVVNFQEFSSRENCETAVAHINKVSERKAAAACVVR